MRQHKGKTDKRPRLSPTRRPPIEKKYDRRAPKQGFEEFFRQHIMQMPVRSNLSKDQVSSKFKSTLKGIGAQYRSISIEATEEPDSILVFMDEQRNLILRYNPLVLGTMDEEGIEAILLHEACHVITLPTTYLRVPDIDDPEYVSFMADYLESYDEYLAHVEFVRRFRRDDAYEQLRNYEISLFQNFETIHNSLLMSLDELQRMGQNELQFKFLRSIHAIAYDALFFYVSNDDSFSTWCNTHNLNGLHTFIGWVFQDYEYVRGLKLTWEETQDKVVASAILSMSVDPLKLLTVGRIEFAETTRDLHVGLINEGNQADLAQLWEKRRILYEGRT
jgi:hypothetical protein